LKIKKFNTKKVLLLLDLLLLEIQLQIKGIPELSINSFAIAALVPCKRTIMAL
jgi:hypothetical protein